MNLSQNRVPGFSLPPAVDVVVVAVSAAAVLGKTFAVYDVSTSKMIVALHTFLFWLEKDTIMIRGRETRTEDPA